jgi:hypothetical protein
MLSLLMGIGGFGFPEMGGGCTNGRWYQDAFKRNYQVSDQYNGMKILSLLYVMLAVAQPASTGEAVLGGEGSQG